MQNSTPHIQEQLIAACLAGNRRAQQALYEQYAKAMLNTAYRIVNHRQEAEDIMQESFLAAFKALKGFRTDGNLAAWLKRIVINHAINSLKKKKILCMESFEGIQEVDFPAIMEEEEFEPEVQQARIALQDLPVGFRTVFSLYVLEGYDHKEIAEVLGISVSTSISQLSRAKQKLRKMLTQQNPYGQSRKVV